jgi:hypothetical protein
MNRRWVRCDKETCKWWQIWSGQKICEACKEQFSNWSFATQVAANIQSEEVEEIMRMEREQRHAA